MENVINAVLCMYGVNEGDQNASIKYLTQFQESDDAWEIALQLIGNDTPHLIYWGINTLHSKLKQHSRQIPVNKVSFVAITLESIYTSRAQQASIQSKMAQTLAACYVLLSRKSQIKLIQAIDKCLDMLQMSVYNAVTGLVLLSAIAEEIQSFCETANDSCLRSLLEEKSCAIMSGVLYVLNRNYPENTSQIINSSLEVIKYWMNPLGGLLAIINADNPSSIDLVKKLLDYLHWGQSISTSSALLLSDSLAVFSYPKSREKTILVQSVLNHVISNDVAEIYFNAEQSNDTDICRAIVQVSSSLCECECESIVELQNESHVRLVQLMQRFTRHRNRGIGSLTLDFWLAIQDIPMNQRHLYFQGEVFLQLIDSIVLQCAYPKSDEDDESWESFRIGPPGVKDVLISILYILKEQYFYSIIKIMMENSLNLEMVESGLWCIASVARPLLKETEIQNSSSMSLLSLFYKLSELPSHTQITSTACSLIGSYSKWIGSQLKDHSDLMEVVMKFVLNALLIDDASQSAATALHRLCVDCSSFWAAHSNILNVLIVTLNSTCMSESSSIGIGSRMVVTEGICRVISNMKRDEATIMFHQLIEVPLVRLHTAVISQSDSKFVMWELSAISSALKYMEFKSSKSLEHPLRPILNRLWPLIEATLSKFASNEKVLESICSLFSTLVVSSKDLIRNQIQKLISLVLIIYNQCPIVQALNMLNNTVELFGKEDQNIFAEILQVITEKTVNILRENLISRTDLSAAYFQLMQRYLVFIPLVLLEHPYLGHIFAICGSVSFGSGNEQQSTRSALRWLSQVLDKGLTLASNSVMRVITDYGVNKLLQQLTHFIVHDGSLSLVGHASDAMYNSLVISGASSNPDAILNILQGHPKIVQYLVEVSERETVVKIMLQLISTPSTRSRSKFKAMITDLANICRGNQNFDVMLAYMLN